MVAHPPLQSGTPPPTEGPEPASTDATAPRALVRLCAAGFVAYGGYAICCSPLLPLFAHDLGARPSAIGLVVGASTVTGIFVKMPAGTLSDVLGRRPLLLAGALVFGLMPFAYLGVSTLAALIVLRMVHGCATAIFGPVASAMVSDLAPAAQRGTWLGTYATTIRAQRRAGRIPAALRSGHRRIDRAAAWVALRRADADNPGHPPIHRGDLGPRGRRGVIVAGLAVCSIAVGALSVTNNSWILRPL